MRSLNALKKYLMQKVGIPECFACGQTNMKMLTLHHHAYHNDSIIYDSYGNTDDERLKYYANLNDEVKQRPENFTVLCHTCHQIVEWLLTLPFHEAYNWIQAQNDERIPGIERCWEETREARHS